MALVFPKEMFYKNLLFFVTTSQNQGINAKLFSNMEEAVGWIIDG